MGTLIRQNGSSGAPAALFRQLHLKLPSLLFQRMLSVDDASVGARQGPLSGLNDCHDPRQG
jgi:hypothetical protein